MKTACTEESQKVVSLAVGLPADGLAPDGISAPEISCVAHSPDGTLLAWAAARTRFVSIVPWVLNTSHKPPPLRCVDVSLDCGYEVVSLAFGSRTPADTAGLNEERLQRFARYRFKPCLQLTRLVLATGHMNGRIRVWDLSDGGRMLFELLDHKKVVVDVKFAPNGSLQLASASKDGTIKLWDLLDDGNMYATLRHPNKNWACSVAWHPSAGLLAGGGTDKQVTVWDVTEVPCRQVTRLAKAHHHNVVCVCFSPDGALIATASYDTRVLVSDAYTGAILRQLLHMYPMPTPIYASGANSFWLRSVAFSRDGTHLASVCDDGYIRFWELDDSERPDSVAMTMPNNALCCSFSSDGATLAVGTCGGTVDVFRSPAPAPTLQHLCRMVIRRRAGAAKLSELNLPRRINNFLLYRQNIS